MNDILGWMYEHTPGFMRPAVSWLLEGLRRIIDFIASRWNWLGISVERFIIRVLYWRERLGRFVATIVWFAVWLRTVFIPGFVSRAVQELLDVVRDAVRWLLGLIEEARDLAQWLVRQAVELLSALISDVLEFARYWIDRILSWADRLVEALGHVLHGPDVLAEWLVGAMWRASLRYIRSQQDRIAHWILRESVTATRWLATELENVIMRWL